MILIDESSIMVAFILLLIATYTDLQCMRIPNSITIPSIISGIIFLIIRCIGGYHLAHAMISVALSFVFLYLLWKNGSWGGGDAKATLAVVILMSPVFEPLLFIAIFFFSLSTLLLIKNNKFVNNWIHFVSNYIHLTPDKKGSNTKVPLAPFLLLSFTMTLVLMLYTGDLCDQG
jgi:Flp pilus assembly protein protease CpaA